MRENRIPWIDTAKALGITLVVLGHMSIPASTRQYIFSFHMPLFFFLSGYVFDPDKYRALSEFVDRRLRSLILPYLLFSLVAYVFWVLVDNNVGQTKGSAVLEPFLGIFYSNNRFANMSHNIALWFITCLFVVEVMFFEMRKRVSSVAGQGLLLLASSVLGYVSSLYWPYPLPWSIEVAFMALPFYGAGYLLRLHGHAILLSSRGYRPVLLLIALACSGIFCYLNGRTDMHGNHYNNYFYFFGAAFGGIMTYVYVSQLFPVTRVMSFIGKNTLIILALSGIAESFLKGIQLFVLGIPLGFARDSLLLGLIYTVCSMVVLSPVIYLVNRRFPMVLGRPYPARKMP
jgi:acyltransferase